MDEDLKKRFLAKKIEDLLTDNIQLLPTIICERDDLKITEMIRRNIFVAIEYGGLIPFTREHIRPLVKEKLETKKKMILGNLYIDVNIN